VKLITQELRITNTLAKQGIEVMATTKTKAHSISHKQTWTENLGIGLGQRPQHVKQKSPSLCNEETCHNPITHWLKFKSGRVGFYCNEHKEQFKEWSILERTESAKAQEEK
jgi:hypothetical protein